MKEQLIVFEELPKKFKNWYLIEIRSKRKDYDKFSDETLLKKLSRQPNEILLFIVQKWLREKHSLHISLYVQENTYLHRWRVKVFYLDKLEDPNVHFWDFDTYEEALEKGLQGALNLI